MIVTYTDEDGNEFEVSFEYDPFLYEEVDPSQSPWHYITIESVTNNEGEEVEFDDDELYNLKEWIWSEYKNEI